MEKHRRYTIVLSADGHFQKAKVIKGADIGEEVMFVPIGQHNFKWDMFGSINFGSMPVRVLTVAALFMLIVLPFFLIPGKTEQTYAYVNLDINPSLELHVDRDMVVQTVIGLNQDAKKLLRNSGDFEGRKLEEVVNDIMDHSVQEHLNKNGKRILVGVSYAEGVKNDVSIVKKLNKGILEEKEDWDFAAYKIPNSIWKKAKEKNISVNKLIATEIEKLDSSILKKLTESGSFSSEDKALIHSFYYPSESKDNDMKDSKAKLNKKSKKVDEKNDIDKKKELNKEENIKEPVKEPIKQPVKQPVKEQTKQPINEPAKQPTKKPTKKPVKTHEKNKKQDNENKRQDYESEKNRYNNNDQYNSNNPNYKGKGIDYKNNNPYRQNYKNQNQNRNKQYQNDNDDENDDDKDNDKDESDN